jgi:hypothetical protein
MTLPDLENLHRNMARDAMPNGGTLTCERCGRTRDVSSADCRTYLARGWPTCCGLTMRLDTHAAR